MTKVHYMKCGKVKTEPFTYTLIYVNKTSFLTESNAED